MRHYHILAIFMQAALMLGMVQPAVAQWHRLTNLPAVYIDTYNNTRIVSKTDYVWASMHYVDETDQVTFAVDSLEIRGRGNSTWNMPKKPYKLKFQTKQKLLGKGYANAKKWVLLANAADKTMMRNALTSALGEFAGLAFNPACRFVDLVLNGSYQGTYQLTDQIDVRPHRVDIAEQDYPITLISDITGGYLMEVDGGRESTLFSTPHYGVPIRIHYPDDDEIAGAQNTYIRNYITDFEDHLWAADFADPQQGYRSYVDSLSLANLYLCTEVSANIDGFYSFYFYKQRQQKPLFWGPLWDYDIAYNNDWRMWNERSLNTTVHSLMSDIAYGTARMWFVRMWEDPWFARLIQRRYQELLDAGLVARMHHVVDSLAGVLAESQQLNYEHWGIDVRAYHETVLYSTYDEYVADLKTFVTERCAWLKRAFAGNKDVLPTPVFEPDDVYYRIVSANTGKAIELNAAGQAVQCSAGADHPTADWQVVPTGDGYFLFLNRGCVMALSDPTMGESTATTNVGTPLASSLPDTDDDRQLWELVAQGEGDRYNLLNVHTRHAANLQGGNGADGTPVLSYTNDSRNASSANRQWRMVPTDTGVEIPHGIVAMAIGDYALAYNGEAQLLHFGAADAARLTFDATVFTAAGKRVGRFRADETFSTGTLPPGVYIVVWSADGKPHSAKFMK